MRYILEKYGLIVTGGSDYHGFKQNAEQKEKELMSAGFSDTYQDILSGSDRCHFLHRRSSGRVRFYSFRAAYFAGQRLGAYVVRN